jgi:hypothetical protein
MFGAKRQFTEWAERDSVMFAELSSAGIHTMKGRAVFHSAPDSCTESVPGVTRV